MPVISIAEYFVYALLAYSGMLMLIISTIKEVPAGKALSITRCIYFIPCIVAAGILANSGVDITINTVDTSTLIQNVNSTETWTQLDVQANKIILQNPAWILIHIMMFIVMIVYVITQLLILFTKSDRVSNF